MSPRLIIALLSTIAPGGAMASGKMGEGDPAACWLCDAAVHSMGVVEASMKTGSGELVKMLFPLMTLLLMVSLCYGTLVSIIEGRNPFDRFKDLAGRILVIGALMAVPATFGATVSEWVIGPVVSTGTRIAKGLGETSATAMGVKLDGQCTVAKPSDVKVEMLAEATTAMGEYACRLHQAASVGVRMGSYVYNKDVSWWPLFGLLKTIFFMVAGFVFMALAMFAMLSFGFALVEAIVKLAVLGACAPLIAFAWLFQSTRETAKNAVSMLFFSLVYLAMSGVGATLVAFAVTASMALGLDLPATSTPDEIKSGFDRLADQFVGISTMGPFVKFCFFAVAGYAVAGKMMKSTQTVAAEVCNFAQGQAGEMANAGQSAVSGFAKAYVGAVVVMAPVAARIGGSMVGKAVGGYVSKQAGGLSKMAGAAGGAGFPGGAKSASEAIKTFGPQLVK